MDILSVTSECAPLIKTGGLADVAGALPAALAPLGITVRTLLPGYPAVTKRTLRKRAELEFDNLFGGPAKLLASNIEGLDLLILDAPHLFNREGAPYTDQDGRDWHDNAERFAALSFVAAQISGGRLKNWQPEILHCHDWQAGFAPDYLKKDFPHSAVKSLITIHNVAFQGNVAADNLTSLQLPPERMTSEGFEYWGQISSLKAAITLADRVTTVSPTYAEELLTPEFGMGLDGVLRSRRDVLSGILNGVDLDVWNPPFKTPAGKASYKKKLRKIFGLGDAPGPLCVLVSRLTDQKGLDLLRDALPRLLDEGGQLALLGSGERVLEQAFQELADQHPNVGVRIGYDEQLARQMIEGGDAILVPSRFEPCGLTQLYGLRYGTIPLVALTGGLADTIIPATPAGLRAGVATGLQFHPITADALSRALEKLCQLYRDKLTWKKMQSNAMKHPVGWDQSAKDYARLYQNTLDEA